MNEPNKILKEKGFSGFAELYLQRCEEKSKSDHEIDVRAFTKLLELDSRLGMTACEILVRLLFRTKTWNIIKV